MDPDEPKAPSGSPARTRFLAAAARIGEVIQERAVAAKDGSVTWLGPRIRGSSTRMVGLGPPLYDGTLGVAVFLAALARARGDESLRVLSRKAVEPLRQLLSGLASDPLRAAGVRLRIGGLVGVGSFLYSFVKLAELLADPAFLEDARRCTALLTPERIQQDQRFDVFLGSAGCILALLHLAEKERDGGSAGTDLLDLAGRCADRLLLERRSWAGHPRAWSAPDQPPLTGFSHGAAGISYALLRLYSAAGQEEHRQAALEGMEFERAFYLPEHRNWRDLRHEATSTMTSYCHGAPGIALARLAIRRLVNDARIDEEIAVGIETTVAHGLGQLDHVCCGNMGRAEVLLRASRDLARTDLRARAEDLAGRVLDRAERSGRFSWLPMNQEVFDPTMFSGAAGIGYTLLRLADPESLPCLLLLE